MAIKNKVVDEEWPKHTKKRKVVQIIPGKNEQIYALTDDHKIFRNWLDNGWQELPPIPQD